MLYTGRDFSIVDFEGESLIPWSQRRIKHSPLHDVTSMLRSFHYAVYRALYGHSFHPGRTSAVIRPQDVPFLEPWARLWYLWVGAAFLKSYQEATRDAKFLPKTREETRMLCEAFLFSKAFREITHELQNHPSSLAVPVRALLQMLEPPKGG